MNSIHIGWWELGISVMLLVIPVLVFAYYKTGMVKSTLTAFGRMLIQLSLVGFYLEFIFELNSVWINILWLLIMIFAAAFTISSRAELKIKHFLLPLTAAILADLLINGSVIAFFVLGSESFFNARYFIPIAGMLVGNCLGAAIIGIRSFYMTIMKEKERYRYYLASGASQNEALFVFTRDAIKEALNPTIANTASIGLIWLPGMMTGQLLGGSDPMDAIKYQIMIIVTIFVGSVLTVLISIIASKKVAFDDYSLFKQSVLAIKTAKKNHPAKTG